VGIVAHEGNKHEEDITMNQLLELYMIQQGSKTKEKINDNQNHQSTLSHGTFKPAFAYRLDKDTS